MSSKQFWIGVVSHAHVQIGVSSGFMQLNHATLGPKTCCGLAQAAYTSLTTQ